MKRMDLLKLKKNKGTLVLFRLSSLVLGVLLLVGGIPLALCVPNTNSIVHADTPTITKEVLSDGVVRVNPYTTESIVSSFGSTTTYQDQISLLPTTLSDLRTKIVCEWLRSTDIDGVTTLSTGANTYSASIIGTRVSVQYKGSLCIWNPTIATGSTNFSLYYGPVVVTDPFNPNYEGNTVEWKYHCDIGGFLGIGTRTVTVIRYLRQIEGCLYECYVLDSDPGSGFTIYQGYSQESSFSGKFTVGASDYNNKMIPVSYNQTIKYVSENSLKGVTYPVTIDPTFFGTSSDCYAGYFSSTDWSTVRDSLSSNDGPYSSMVSQVICEVSGGYYGIERSFLYFGTNKIKVGSTINSANLSLYSSNSGNFNDDSTSLVVTKDGTNYPEDPYQTGNFYIAQYTSVMGSISINSIPTSGYFTIDLDTSSIVLGGTTKFMLCLGKDWTGVPPPIGYNEVDFYDTSMGIGYLPLLTVTWTSPSTVPAVTTGSVTQVTSNQALLAGTLTSTGGSTPVTTYVKYGITSSYGLGTTTSQSMYSTGTFSGYTGVLQAGTIYHCAAYAVNGIGDNTGSDQIFLTLPEGPTGFTVTPGNTNNTLNWTIGTGATSTLIRYSTTGFPSSTSDGTQLTISTGNSYIHTGLTNGQIYYYSMWSYTSVGGLSQYSTFTQQVAGTPVFSGAPNVDTYAASSVTQTTAVFNGKLVSLQGSSSATCWFQYYTGGGTWTDNPNVYVVPDLTSAPLNFNSPTVTGLTVNTTYHMRAAAQNIYGTTYGTDIPFTTNSSSAPTMLTTYAAVSYNSATLNGRIVSDGNDLAGVTVWFEYGPTSSYGYNSSYSGGQFTGSIPSLTLTSSSVPNFVSGSTWHYQIVGKNSFGTNLGGDVNFTLASPNIPICNTSSAINVGSSSATLQGTVVSDGGAVGQVSVGFYWGTDITYGNFTGWQTGYSAGQSFNYTISGLQLFTIYHFMAVVQNVGGTGNGTDSQFMTQFAAPGFFTAVATSPTAITVSWVPMGDDTGIWMSTSAYPLDRLSSPSSYFGTGSSTSFTNLQPGTTYFFRAWTFSNSFSWSPTYSEDAVTTPGQQSSVIVNGTNITVSLTEPPEYFQSPNGSNLSKWPGYALVQQAATGTGIPEGTLWLIIVLTISSACGLIAWGISGSLGFVIVTVCVVMAVASIMHLLSMWILFAFVLIGGSLAMVLRHNA